MRLFDEARQALRELIVGDDPEIRVPEFRLPHKEVRVRQNPVRLKAENVHVRSAAVRLPEPKDIELRLPQFRLRPPV